MDEFTKAYVEAVLPEQAQNWWKLDRSEIPAGPSLAEAFERLEEELPGWWWTIGLCHLSADATVGPDMTGPDAHLLDIKEFDEGFDGSLLWPATPAEALMNAIDLALEAKKKLTA